MLTAFLKVWKNGDGGGGGGGELGYPEKAPDNQPENRYHDIIKGEN